MPQDDRKLTRAARARAAETGESYTAARQALLDARHPAPVPAAEPDTGELARRLQADQATAGITLSDERARELVEFTRGLFRRHMTSAPFTVQARDDTLVGPHCDHHDLCAMDVCQDGYAWGACSKAGCPVCGGPPITTPEHWSGDVVALALMTDADRERALAHQRAFPLLRRPGDPATIPGARRYGPPGDPDEECWECGAMVQAGYTCDCDREHHDQDEEEYA